MWEAEGIRAVQVLTEGEVRDVIIRKRKSSRDNKSAIVFYRIKLNLESQD